MLGFHIDMNVARFKKSYLEKWLKELSSLGYDAIFWELEDNVQWQTCPECVSPEAFSKEEFRDILKLCKKLSLESIPVLQTLGHCEYVLKNDRYKHLAELPSKIDQYCPLHPQLAEFIKRWIDEYIELFGPIKRFHIGADEAFDLGKCPRCSEFAKKHSLSELYVQYVEMIAGHLIKQDIQPIIWADMVLKHPEDINRLSHKIIFADWGYNIYHGSGKVWVWSREQLCTAEQLDSETLKVFGKFLFPDGDEPGREPVTFYC
jgi:hexosaminidase